MSSSTSSSAPEILVHHIAGKNPRCQPHSPSILFIHTPLHPSLRARTTHSTTITPITHCLDSGANSPPTSDTLRCHPRSDLPAKPSNPMGSLPKSGLYRHPSHRQNRLLRRPPIWTQAATKSPTLGPPKKPSPQARNNDGNPQHHQGPLCPARRHQP